MAKAQNEARTELGQKEAQFEHEMHLAKDRFLTNKEAELIRLNARYSSKIDSLNGSNNFTEPNSTCQHSITYIRTCLAAPRGQKPVATCTDIIGFAPIPDVSSESDADEEPQTTGNGPPLTSLLGDMLIAHATVGMLAEALAKKRQANIRELFKTTFHATKDEEYMLHVPALHKAILSFAAETGPDPNPLSSYLRVLYIDQNTMTITIVLFKTKVPAPQVHGQWMFYFSVDNMVFVGGQRVNLNLVGDPCKIVYNQSRLVNTIVFKGNS
ncbi:hypothetical protein DFJ58DRAFT_847136 [Suillus subalutaceus]|uniref:uncharacterized protein n=1 Tax=Suillus subalutaceus TaxID=48586 RepID=UPI001B869602|nr:uncharacterized protein DFJ58DRAFT_847136 [Suillus subalutaceus]KAG1836144.1 hypothetical protein DFJ58DRAFT_847136 [Suillus subalutaceus]